MKTITLYPWKYRDQSILEIKNPLVNIDVDDIIIVKLGKHFKNDNTHFFYFMDKRKYLEIDNGDNCYGPNSVYSNMFFARHTNLSFSLPESEKILLNAGLIKLEFWNDEEGKEFYYVNPKNIERIYLLTEEKDTKEYGYYCPIYIFEYKDNYGHQLGLKKAWRVKYLKELPKSLESLMVERIVTVTYKKKKKKK